MWDDGCPRTESGKQLEKRRRDRRIDCRTPFAAGVSTESDNLTFSLAVPIKRPFVSVSVEKIRDNLKPMPLFQIVSLVESGIRSLAGGLSFDITDRLFLMMSREIRLSHAVPQVRLPRKQDFTVDDPAVGFE